MDVYKSSIDFITDKLVDANIQSDPLILEIADNGDAMIGAAIDSHKITSDLIESIRILFNDSAESIVRFNGGSVFKSDDMTTPLFMLRFTTSKEC